ncbi:MAG TPA: hypothetical protein VK658_21985 [Chryseolinea sp.]|nr:hypothetical protein [Chryseolinea sp.]
MRIVCAVVDAMAPAFRLAPVVDASLQTGARRWRQSSDWCPATSSLQTDQRETHYPTPSNPPDSYFHPWDTRSFLVLAETVCILTGFPN